MILYIEERRILISHWIEVWTVCVRIWRIRLRTDLARISTMMSHLIYETFEFSLFESNENYFCDLAVREAKYQRHLTVVLVNAIANRKKKNSLIRIILISENVSSVSFRLY